MSRKEFDQFIEKLCVIRQGIALDCYKQGYDFHEAFEPQISRGTVNQLVLVVGTVIGQVHHLEPVHIISMLDVAAVTLPFMQWDLEHRSEWHTMRRKRIAKYRGPRVHWERGKVTGRDL